MLLIPPGQQPENPWQDKVPAAVQQVTTSLREALEAAWRADAWQTGLRLARAALAAGLEDTELRGPIVRALWRAGCVAEAETVAAGIRPDRADRLALRTLLEIEMAGGRSASAAKLADRLEALPPRTAEELTQLFSVRFAQNRLEGMPELVRQAEKLVDARNGYPETFLAEAISGLADFLAAVGTQPLNQVTQFGAAPMPPLVLLNLPSCEVLINGHGPYRMVVDTGGSIVVALDQAIADEIGLKSLAQASIRGVSGKTETGQVLIDELQVGTIKCRRVVTRTFDLRGAILNAADGIVGTGVFAGTRLTLDFERGQLMVAASSEQPGPGGAVDLRVVSDAKLLVPVMIQGQPAMGLLDTGADVVAMSPSRLKDLFPDQKIRTFSAGLALGIGAGQIPEISTAAGATVVFGGREFKNCGGVGLDVLDKTLGPAIGVQADILLGMPIFRQMKSCTIDFPRCKLWVDWRPQN